LNQDKVLTVAVFDQQLQTTVSLEADLLVLSAAIRPRPQGQKLAEVLRLPLDQDGFFMEAHPKLRPLDFTRSGFFLCGLAQGPKFAGESISQARGAVSRAMAILSRKDMRAEGMITHVDRELCRACGECEKVCLFDAIHVKQDEYERKAAVVAEHLCTGCGACNVACPTGAASLAHFHDDQVNAVIKSFRD
jgi:heterodisulfide reductase subunit A